MLVEIRDAHDQDAEALAPLMSQLMHLVATPDQIRARLRRVATTGVDRVFVASVDGLVVGFAGLTHAWLLPADAPTARLMSIVVDERCRGQGIGRRLVEASIEQARAWGCDRLEPGVATGSSSPAGSKTSTRTPSTRRWDSRKSRRSSRCRCSATRRVSPPRQGSVSPRSKKRESNRPFESWVPGSGGQKPRFTTGLTLECAECSFYWA